MEFDFGLAFWNQNVVKQSTKEPVREIQIRYKKFVYTKDTNGQQSLVRVKKNSRTKSLDAPF